MTQTLYKSHMLKLSVKRDFQRNIYSYIFTFRNRPLKIPRQPIVALTEHIGRRKKVVAKACRLKGISMLQGMRNVMLKRFVL